MADENAGESVAGQAGGGSSSVRVICPECQNAAQVSAECAGKRIQCPVCRTVCQLEQRDGEEESVKAVRACVDRPEDTLKQIEELGDFQKAMNDYRRAVELNERDFLAGDGISRVAFELGRYEDAIEAMRAAMTVAPSLSSEEKASGYFSLGQANRKLGRNDDALEAYARTLKYDSEYWEAYANRTV